MGTLFAEQDDALTIEAPYDLETARTGDELALLVVLAALLAPDVLQVGVRRAVDTRLMTLSQDIQLRLLHVTLLTPEGTLDQFKISIHNLIFCQIEVVSVLAIESNGVHSFAVAKGVMGDALATEYLGHLLRLFKDLLKVLFRTVDVLFLVPDLCVIRVAKYRAMVLVMLAFFLLFSYPTRNKVTDGYFSGSRVHLSLV